MPKHSRVRLSPGYGIHVYRSDRTNPAADHASTVPTTHRGTYSGTHGDTHGGTHGGTHIGTHGGTHSSTHSGTHSGTTVRNTVTPGVHQPVNFSYISIHALRVHMLRRHRLDDADEWQVPVL